MGRLIEKVRQRQYRAECIRAEQSRLGPWVYDGVTVHPEFGAVGPTVGYVLSPAPSAPTPQPRPWWKFWA